MADYTFTVRDGGEPKSGLSPVFDVFVKRSDSTSAGTPPTITAIAGGGYKFSVTVTEDVYCEIDADADSAGGGTLAADERYKCFLLTSDDANITNLDSSVQAVQDQADKIDNAAMTSPGAVITNSFADYLMNKDGNKTYDKSLHSNEGIFDLVLTRLASQPFDMGQHPDAHSILNGNGVIVDGTVGSLATFNGIVTIGETGGTGKFEYQTEWQTLGSATYEHIHMRIWYFGNPSHVIRLMMWNYNLSSWQYITTNSKDIPATLQYQNLVFTINPAVGVLADYFDGDNAKVLFIHESNAVASHFLFIDMVGFGEMEPIYEAPDNAGIASIRQTVQVDGAELSATAVQDIWDALTSNLTTPGSVGKLLTDNLTAILADTAEIQGDLADDGRLDLIFDDIRIKALITLKELVVKR